jgi:AcrR family transcriptional regulator
LNEQLKTPIMIDGDETRRRILDAAGPLFAAKGRDATSVREICERAEANVSAVNYHFRTKEHLYVEAVRHAYQTCAAAAPLPSWPPGTPAEERLRDFIRVELQRVAEPRAPEWHRLLTMREVAQPTEACTEFVREFIRPAADILLSILDELVPAEVPVARRRLLTGSIIGQCLHYHHCRHIVPLLFPDVTPWKLDVEVLTEHITAFSLAAIRGMFRPRAHGAKT